MVSPQPLAAFLIDVGNSHIRLAGWPSPGGVENATPVRAHPLQRLGSWPTLRADAGDAEEFCSDLKKHLERGPEIPLVLVSVVPAVTELVRENWPDVIVVDHTCNLPFGVAVHEPSQVGADRLCNMAAAVQANLKSAIVVDAGTATTVDVLHQGVFEGGLIAPGMASAAATLTQGTAQLPEIPFAAGALQAGRSTAEAMSRGAFQAGIGGIEALIGGVLAQFGPLPVVTTGGLGHFLSKPGRGHDPDWTFRGAAYLAQMT